MQQSVKQVSCYKTPKKMLVTAWLFFSFGFVHQAYSQDSTEIYLPNRQEVAEFGLTGFMSERKLQVGAKDTLIYGNEQLYNLGFEEVFYSDWAYGFSVGFGMNWSMPIYRSLTNDEFVLRNYQVYYKVGYHVNFLKVFNFNPYVRLGYEKTKVRLVETKDRINEHNLIFAPCAELEVLLFKMCLLGVNAGYQLDPFNTSWKFKSASSVIEPTQSRNNYLYYGVSLSLAIIE